MAGDAPFSDEDGATRPDQEAPSWEPYQSPESGGNPFRLLRRYAFSITVVTAAVAIGALIYFAPTQLAPEEGSSIQTTDPVTNDEARATLSVSSQPTGAAVIVGADTVGVTPIENHKLSAGTYLVTVTREDYESRDTVLTLSDGESAAFTSRLTQAESAFEEQDLTDASPPTNEDPSALPGDESPAANPSSSEPPLPDEAPSSSSGMTVDEPPSPAPENDDATPVTGTLVLRTTPDGTTVKLDGNEVATTPTTLTEVEAGTHEVNFVRSGYQTVTRLVEVSGNDTMTIAATLERQTGHLRVLVRPWGSIYIDDERYVENTDVWFDTSLPVGTITVSAQHPALGEKSRSVTVAPQDTQSVILDLRDQ